MFRYVLFDIDGTLIPAHGRGVLAFEKAFFNLYGVPHATRNVDFAGRTDWAITHELFDAHHIPHSSSERHRFLRTYENLLEAIILEESKYVLPGVETWIEVLATHRLPMGLLTGNTRTGAETKLRHVGLWHHFEFGAFGNESPDRSELARLAIQRGQALHGETSKISKDVLVIGDTPRDIACAHASGARCLAVATGSFSEEELSKAGADWTTPHLAAWSFQPFGPLSGEEA